MFALAMALTWTARNVAWAQYFPSDALTKGFEDNLHTIAQGKGAAFLSVCRDPANGGLAILIMPVGSESGTLTLAVYGRVYNGAGVESRNGKALITEGGGGEWSYRRLQFFAEILAGGTFRLKRGSELTHLLQMKPKTSCPAFKDARR